MRTAKEWFKQAAYDLGTARAMLKSKRNIYAVFMSHLAVEKALKGLYQHRLGKTPPKTHNLMFLARECRIESTAPEDIARLFTQLTEAHVVTRYPEDLRALQAVFPDKRVRALMTRSKEAIAWIKRQSEETS